jgi:hypothetical protein
MNAMPLINVDFRNSGNNGIIMSEEKSVNRLTHPAAFTVGWRLEIPGFDFSPFLGIEAHLV